MAGRIDQQPFLHLHLLLLATDFAATWLVASSTMALPLRGTAVQ